MCWRHQKLTKPMDRKKQWVCHKNTSVRLGVANKMNVIKIKGKVHCKVINRRMNQVHIRQLFEEAGNTLLVVDCTQRVFYKTISLRSLNFIEA